MPSHALRFKFRQTAEIGFDKISTEAVKNTLDAKLDVIQVCIDPIWV